MEKEQQQILLQTIVINLEREENRNTQAQFTAFGNLLVGETKPSSFIDYFRSAKNLEIDKYGNVLHP